MTPVSFADQLSTQLIRAQHDSGGSADGMRPVQGTRTNTATGTPASTRMSPSQGPSGFSQATTLTASSAGASMSAYRKLDTPVAISERSEPVSPGSNGQTGYFTMAAPNVTTASSVQISPTFSGNGDYFTKGAPYLAFLNAATKVPDSSHVYPAAFRPLLEKLRQDAHVLGLELQSSITTDRAPDHILARVLDIKLDNDVRVTHDLLDQALVDPRDRLSAVRELTQVLQTSTPDLHTRMLLLCRPKERSADTTTSKVDKQSKTDMAKLRRSLFSMMLAHLFGIVLDMDVDSVAALGVGLSKYDDKQRAFCNPQRQGIIECSDDLCRLTWVGTHGEGENQHLLAIVLFAETPEYMCPKLELRPSQIHQGALLSLQMQQAMSCGIIAVYTRFLKHAAWTSQASIKLKPRTHWLDALIRMELHRCHVESARIHHAGYLSGSPHAQLRKWQIVTTRMQTTLERLSDYERIAIADATSDIATTRQIVEAFAAEMHRNTESLRVEADEMKERRATVMAESGHREAKRGLLLTFLAAAYLPLNLATGVFSMNVQEIDGDGHWMWVVVVTAALMLLATAMFWWIVKTLQQAHANAVHMRAFVEGEKQEGLPQEAVLIKHAQSLDVSGKPAGKWYHGWRRCLVIAGFKPLEEIDPGLVSQAKRRISEQKSFEVV